MIGRLTAAGIFVDPMEKWTAASDEPKELSMARVKDCHLCILLVGFHLGHVPTGEKRSITQMEYVAARELGVDVLVFMADEEADWPADSLAKLKRDAGIRRWRTERGAGVLRGLGAAHVGAASAGDGVEPAQSREPHEVRVRRVQHGIVVQCQGGHLRVAHQVPRRAEGFQEFERLAKVVGARGDHLHRRLLEPRAHMSRRFRWRHGIHEGASIGGNADKPESDDMQQPNRFDPGEADLPPTSRFGMGGGTGIVGVEQQVDVGNDHLLPPLRRFASTASSSSSSASLLKPAGSKPARRPSGRALITNGRRVAGAVFRPSAARMAALSVCLKPFRERCMASRSICSTSRSKVTVVRMEAS